MTIKLATINLEVSDVGRARAFYVDALGMTEDAGRSHPPDFAYLRSAAGHLTLARRRTAAPGPDETIELGFETTELAAVQARLEAHGVAVDARAMGWGEALELRDPDARRVVVYTLA
jgi:catechol 2,3-dioxygenase-like lactoylglutathione lyase family enzyme